MPNEPVLTSRRGALKCLAFGGAGTLFALAGGVFTPIDLAVAASDPTAHLRRKYDKLGWSEAKIKRALDQSAQ